MNMHEALSEQERALAQRLREWPVVGPSAELDARILAQARAEGGATSAPRRRPQRPFLVGLASAAVLVLTVGVIWQVAEQPPESQPMPAQPEFRAGPQPSSSDAQSPTDSYDGLAEADLDAPAADATEVGSESAPAARVEPDAAPVFAEPPPASPDAPAASRAFRSLPAPASAPTPSDLPMPAPSVSSPPMPYAPATEASAPPAPSAPPVPPPPPVSAAAAQQRTGASAAGVLSREQEPPRKTAEERARGERLDRSALAIGVPDPPSESQALTGPALAIAHIRRLIVTGQTAVALTRIAELRENYPDLELPDDLLLFEHERQQP